MSEGFGDILKKYRKAQKDLTLQKLAERLTEAGYEVAHKSTISKWETGKTKPPELAVDLLEEILSVPPGVLQGAAGYKIPEAGSVSKARAEHFDRLVEFVAELLADGVSTATDEEPELLPGKHVPEHWSMAKYWIKTNDKWQPLLERRELTTILLQRLESMKRHYKMSELNGLMCHVAAEYPGCVLEDRQFKYLGAFQTISFNNPYELIRKLVDLTNTKAFKGTCPDCPQSSLYPS